MIVSPNGTFTNELGVKNLGNEDVGALLHVEPRANSQLCRPLAHQLDLSFKAVLPDHLGIERRQDEKVSPQVTFSAQAAMGKNSSQAVMESAPSTAAIMERSPVPVPMSRTCTLKD